MSCNIFCTSFKLIGIYKSPKKIELYTIQAVMCHTGNISRNKSYEPWKSPKDVLMRCPATYFALVLNWNWNLPKTLNCIQYRLLCVIHCITGNISCNKFDYEIGGSHGIPGCSNTMQQIANKNKWLLWPRVHTILFSCGSPSYGKKQSILGSSFFWRSGLFC